MSFIINGLDEFKRNLEERIKAAQKAAAAGLYAHANNVMTEAKELSPVDTGVMRGSGYVTIPEENSNPVVEVGFGGASEAYVVKQHEDQSLNHPDGGEAKFLEKALDRNKDKASELIGRFIKDALHDGKSAGMDKVHPPSPGGEK